MSYDMIDRFLRNNLGDDDYAEYLDALDSLCQPPQPPQRTWVDLTNEDWNEIFDTALNKVEAIKLTKAKLKQKNVYSEEKNT